jgi:hypothetical protein
MASSPKYSYQLQSFFIDKWTTLFTDTRDFCLGYLTHAGYSQPRNAMRVIRSDGKIISEINPSDEVHIGMIAGWPTPEQYESAAKRALEQAALIRARVAREEERYKNRVNSHSDVN